MKFEETTGCIINSFEIDEKSISDYSEEELIRIMDHVLAELRKDLINGHQPLSEVIRLFEPDNWDYPYGENCECCGDRVFRQTWNIS